MKTLSGLVPRQIHRRNNVTEMLGELFFEKVYERGKTSYVVDSKVDWNFGERQVIMNRLPIEKRVQIIAAMVEGTAINAIVRMTGISKVTILKLLKDVGESCMAFENKALRNLTCKRIQCDEIWSFCYAKEKNVPLDKKGQFGFGDVWTWTALDADTKLLCSWMVGDRSAYTAHAFMKDLAGPLRTRVQLTTDGHRAYLEAVESAFGVDVDYAMWVKLYGNDPEESEARYSPAVHRMPLSGDYWRP